MIGTKKIIQSELARKIIEIAEAKAIELNVAVSIAVVDDAGNLKYFSRMDNSTNCSIEIAILKAKHAINYQRTTKYHQDIVQGGGFAALAFPGILPVEGGIPIQYENEYIGAIGVSGAQSEQDGEIAKYAIEKVLVEKK